MKLIIKVLGEGDGGVMIATLPRLVEVLIPVTYFSYCISGLQNLSNIVETIENNPLE